MSRFYRLSVKAITDETTDARSFVLAPERGETGIFRYLSGQFLTFRIHHETGTILRSYSISSHPHFDPDMTVCVKRVDGGRGSNWFNDHLTVGARIEAQPPAGRFILNQSNLPLLLIAGGSGITPCISLIKQALTETTREVKLVYANQHDEAIIYQHSLHRMTRRYADRFSCVHWLDADRGFLKPQDVIAAAQPLESADSYICGPAPLMDMAEETLVKLFGEQASILTERFVSPDDAENIQTLQTTRPDGIAVEQFRLTLDGIERELSVAANQSLLEAGLAAGIDMPHSCTEGHCGSCMGHLREGEVSMESTRALSKRNIERGYVLACQARPSSISPLWLDFDL
jgi:3-ketosteroid 9alpha-monooxygenase subunit B